MKIQVYLNRIKINYKDDFEKAVDYFKRHGLDVSFDFKEINVRGYKNEFLRTAAGSEQWCLTGAYPLVPKNNADITIFMFDTTEFTPLETMPASNCEYYEKPFINLETHPFDDAVGNTYISICHEIMHALRMMANHMIIPCIDVMDLTPVTLNGVTTIIPYYKNNEPDAPDGNFAKQWEQLKPFLAKIKNNMNQTTQPTGSASGGGNNPTTSAPLYKYFKPSEIVNLKPELVQMLDKARELAGTPFIINNGFRTPAQNKTIEGAAPNSPHMRGLAVDLACNNTTRTKILRGLLTCGIPVFIEVAGRHVHVDIDGAVHPLGDTMWGNDPS